MGVGQLASVIAESLLVSRPTKPRYIINASQFVACQHFATCLVGCISGRRRKRPTYGVSQVCASIMFRYLRVTLLVTYPECGNDVSERAAGSRSGNRRF